jgi:hypothetical protein
MPGEEKYNRGRENLVRYRNTAKRKDENTWERNKDQHYEGTHIFISCREKGKVFYKTVLDFETLSVFSRFFFPSGKKNMWMCRELVE